MSLEELRTMLSGTEMESIEEYFEEKEESRC